MGITDAQAEAGRAGQRYLVLSDLITFAVTGAETRGEYTVLETVTPPQSGSAVLHTHPQQETLYVIEGEYLVCTIAHAALRTLRIGPGGVAHIPGGIPHTVKNESVRPGKLLTIHSPAGIEDLFSELGVAVTDLDAPIVPLEPPTLEHVIAVLAKHRMTFVAPPDT